MQNHLVLTETRGATRIFTLNQPERRNTLSLEMRADLIAGLQAAQDAPDVRAIVITGAGGNFCAGGDLATMKDLSGVAGRERLRRLHQLGRLIVAGSKPVVAAVEGFAYGAGLSLALLCDQVVAANSSRFCASFARVGLMADLAALWTVPQRVNAGWSRRILMLAEEVDATTAERIGLCDALVPDGAALDAALQIADRFAAGAPLVMAYTKQALARGPQGLEPALAVEADLQGLLFSSADLAEGRDAFFAKRRPDFKGR